VTLLRKGSNHVTVLRKSPQTVTQGEYTLEITSPGFCSYRRAVSIHKNVNLKILLHEIEDSCEEENALVVDVETDQPVEGAKVEVKLRGKDGSRRTFSASTGKDGRFTVPGEDGDRSYSLVIRHSNYLAFATSGTGKIGGVFALSKGSGIFGYIEDETGNPLAVREIVAWRGQTRYSPSMQEGNIFRFDSLPTGEYCLYAQAEGYYRLKQQLRLEKGEVKEVQLTFKRGISVEGTVNDLEGKPIEGVRVYRVYVPPDYDPPQDLAYTDNAGSFSFRWPLEPNENVELWVAGIHFQKEGYKHTWILNWHGPPIKVHVVMGNTKSRIEGTVTASGMPLEGKLAIDWKVCEKGGKPLVFAKNGEFSVDGLVPGHRDIVFQAEGYLPISVNVEVPRDAPGMVELNFTDRGGIVTGYVLDPHNQPVDAQVCCFAIEGTPIHRFGAVSTDQTGKYTISGLDGRYNIQALPRDSESLEMPEAVPVQVKPGKVAEHVDFSLQEKNK
jgi:hypothetical protein